MTDQPPKKKPRVNNVRRNRFGLTTRGGKDGRGRGRGKGRGRGTGKRAFITGINEHLQQKKKRRKNPPEDPTGIPAVMNSPDTSKAFTTKSKQDELQKPMKTKRVVAAADFGPTTQISKPAAPKSDKKTGDDLKKHLRQKLMQSMKKKNAAALKKEAVPQPKVQNPVAQVPKPAKSTDASVEVKSPSKKFKLSGRKTNRMVSMGDGFNSDTAIVKKDSLQKPEAAPPMSEEIEVASKPEATKPVIPDPIPPEPKKVPNIPLDLDDFQEIEGVSDAFLNRVGDIVKEVNPANPAPASVDFNTYSVAALAQVKMDIFALDLRFAQKQLDLLKNTSFDA